MHAVRDRLHAQLVGGVKASSCCTLQQDVSSAMIAVWASVLPTGALFNWCGPRVPSQAPGGGDGPHPPPPAVPLLYAGRCAASPVRPALAVSGAGSAAHASTPVLNERVAAARVSAATLPHAPPGSPVQAVQPGAPPSAEGNGERLAAGRAPGGRSVAERGAAGGPVLLRPLVAGAARPSSAPAGAMARDAAPGQASMDTSGVCRGSGGTGGGGSGVAPAQLGEALGAGLRLEAGSGLGSAAAAGAAAAAAAAAVAAGEPVQICFDFTKNACARGAACKYSHDVALIAAVNSQERGICFDFLRGSCARGVICRFSHNMANIQAQQALAQARPRGSPLRLASVLLYLAHACRSLSGDRLFCAATLPWHAKCNVCNSILRHSVGCQWCNSAQDREPNFLVYKKQAASRLAPICYDSVNGLCSCGPRQPLLAHRTLLIRFRLGDLILKPKILTSWDGRRRGSGRPGAWRPSATTSSRGCARAGRTAATRTTSTPSSTRRAASAAAARLAAAAAAHQTSATISRGALAACMVPNRMLGG